MAHTLKLTCLWLLVFFKGLEAFSYLETNNVLRKSSNKDYDFVLGPEFNGYGKFAYVKIKKLIGAPPVIEVNLEVYNRESSTMMRNRKIFQADIGSTNINVTSFKLGQATTIMSINEQRENGESKDMLIRWDSFSYPDSSLYLPKNYIIIGSDWDFDVIIDDNDTCDSSNGKCIYRFQNKEDPIRTGFYNHDLVWRSMQIVRVKPHPNEFLVRGFDSAGKYKFLQCNTESSKELLSLSNVSSAIQTHTLANGVCFIEQPGKDKSARCLKFDVDGKLTMFDRTVTYEAPMYLLDVIYTTSSTELDILLVANRIQCMGKDCFNIVLTKIPHDHSKPITHRHLALDCLVTDKLFKVSLTQQRYSKSLIIEYICENDVEFTFKTVTTND